MTRRRFVAAAGLGVLGLARGRTALAATAGAPAQEARFATQPTWNPPAITVGTAANEVAPGLVFVTPFGFGTGPVLPGTSGPMILDNAGEPVWFLPLTNVRAHNFRAQRYDGRDVLTWYEGPSSGTYGGSCVIYDDSYRELKRVHTAGGLACDLHEFLITARNTGLISIYNEVSADLSPLGMTGTGRVVEGVVQEIDIKTGKLLFEWHSLDHVTLDESYRSAVTPQGNIDYLHLNSIGVDLDGNLLVSARHTSTVYKLDRKTGAVLWRLGGKKSDFTFASGAAFNFQHDVRSHADGTITLFDNGATDLGAGKVEPASRPLRLRLDTTAKTATLVQTYEAAEPRLAFALGDVQQLPGGGVFVGWGTAGAFSEFAPDGQLRYDATIGGGNVSYRTLRLPWRGRPSTRPTAVATTNADGTVTVHASWNGATEVARWQVLAAGRAGAVRVVATARRSGFETAIPVRASGRLAVAALDAHGAVLGTSAWANA